LSLVPSPPLFWGVFILLCGACSGFLGVVFAIAQHDIKRLLAYHSVENIGIILIGLGIALIGKATQQTGLIVLGLSGCLLHVLNHSLFKSLLFFGAGAVIHETNTKQIDQLGRLSLNMPRTAFYFLMGSIAICGLPPLNGFASEFLVYLGIFSAITSNSPIGLAIGLIGPVLAMIGTLAVACFVKVYGTVFLGNSRSAHTFKAHEAPWSMRFPMLCLTLCCFGIGLCPSVLINVLNQAVRVWMDYPTAFPGLSSVSNLSWISVMGFVLLGLFFLVALPFIIKNRRSMRSVTWDCGYAAPTNRMQYTASSFARTIVRMFKGLLRPQTRFDRIRRPFPGSVLLASQVNEVVLDRFIKPVSHRLEHGFGWFHRFQQGLTQYYIAYILLTLIIMLCTLIPFQEVITKLMVR